MQITSPQNPLLQEIRRAAFRGRPTAEGPIAEGWIVIEGPHLIGETIRSHWELGTVVTTPAGRERHALLLENLQAGAIDVPARTFSQLSATENTQEILALVRPPAANWALIKDRLTVVLDGIQDPGNAGTIVRSAEAFGASGIVLLEGSVHVSNGKFLRASAGSLFRLPFLANVERKEFLARTSTAGVPLYALAAKGQTTLSKADFRSPFALIAGSEGGGVAPELLAASTVVSIPTAQVESLNVAVACSIALFEIARQRLVP